MIEIQGKYNVARVMLPDFNYLDEATYAQIIEMINCPLFEGYPISIMPDCHKGTDKGSCIGFTMPLGNYLIPNVIGVDIACGMTAVELGNIEIDYEKFDQFVRKEIPLGQNVHSYNIKIADRELERDLSVLAEKVGCKRTFESVGTLGSGNHFLEIDQDANNNKILVVHSGSRNLGKLTCEYHQEKANSLTPQTKLTNGFSGFTKNTKDFVEYLDDMNTCQQYADLNRITMLNTILTKFFKIEPPKHFKDCKHNYIDMKDLIIRKGAINAHKGNFVIIPLNMRDGIIFGEGKSNTDWNLSAPHGAGRLYSRNYAKNNLSLEEFKESMKDIYSTSVSQSTLDESPQAYKDKNLIIDMIKDIVEIKFIGKPVYNLKA